MDESDMYLNSIIKKYAPKNLNNYGNAITDLKSTLKSWANKNNRHIEIIDSGSRAKGTTISIGSDIDFMVSLTNNCNENTVGLGSIYESLYNELKRRYPNNVKRQNVSVRVTLSLPSASLLSNGLEVDITPARKQPGNTNDHSLWVSKSNTWKQTNIQKHIDDVSKSGRINEIKLLKIWRELNRLDFPSIYLEYLLIDNILPKKPYDKNSLTSNFRHILSALAEDQNNNPLSSEIRDPANTNNIFSDLLTDPEKNKIITKAKENITSNNQHWDWGKIIW